MSKFLRFNGRENFISIHNEKNINLKSDNFIIEDNYKIMY